MPRIPAKNLSLSAVTSTVKTPADKTGKFAMVNVVINPKEGYSFSIASLYDRSIIARSRSLCEITAPSGEIKSTDSSDISSPIAKFILV